MNRKTIIILILFGTAILALTACLIYPLVGQIQKESANLVFQKNRMAELEIKVKNLKDFQSAYSAYQPNLVKIDQSFINKAEPVSFIEFFEKEAAESQLLIEVSAASEYFRLTLTGLFPDFLEFLEKLESSPYLVEVSSLNISRLIKDEESVTITLLAKVYSK